MMVPAALPVTHSEQVKRRQLAVTKRQATALLGAVAAVWLGLVIWGGRAGWVGYAQATAEASMVGGLADWFAVTALFRRPLGLPIPHTAVVVERKDSFGATLGDFIQDSFLTPDTVVERVRAALVVPRAATWLADPEHASRAAGHLAGVAVSLCDAVDDDAVGRALADLVRRRLDDMALAPLAGRALGTVLADGSTAPLMAASLHGVAGYLEQHRGELRAQLTGESPWWLPGPVEDRIVEHLVDGAVRVLDEMATDPDHPLRLELEAQLATLALELESSPSMRAKGEELKAELLSRPQLTDWMGSLWTDLKGQLRVAADDPASDLRGRIAGLVAAAGRRLQDDRSLAARVEEGVERGVRQVAGRFHGEISALVSHTIARWDSEETARRLELLLGPDLQYIRINGTVVGAGAGLVLYTIARLLSG
jgi:uncharacterized membrane-anchored protein YjiN (DUF445 family)